jgi:hypothetical protein
MVDFLKANGNFVDSKNIGTHDLVGLKAHLRFGLTILMLPMIKILSGGEEFPKKN